MSFFDQRILPLSHNFLLLPRAYSRKIGYALGMLKIWHIRVKKKVLICRLLSFRGEILARTRALIQILVIPPAGRYYKHSKIFLYLAIVTSYNTAFSVECSRGGAERCKKLTNSYFFLFLFLFY